MTKQGSQQFSWKLHGIPPERRFCAHCGRKLQVQEPGGLWLTEVEDGRPLAMTRVAHFRCELEYRRGERIGLLVSEGGRGVGPVLPSDTSGVSLSPEAPRSTVSGGDAG